MMNSNYGNYYKPTVEYQTARLASKQSGWNLPGGSSSPTTRTRHGGQGRPNLSRLYDLSLVESDDEEEEEHEEEEQQQEEVEVEDEAKKPPFSRVIMEVDAISDAMEKHCCCAECKGPMTMTMTKVCLATKIVLTCNDPQCGYAYKGDAARVELERPNNRDKSTDYALNVLYIVAFITCGDGGAEAARLLGLLGLANDTTMETRSFQIIEERIGPAIRRLTTKILDENLVAEVKATMDSLP
jgi:hypothetical protein